jgi:hypothetical protein
MDIRNYLISRILPYVVILQAVFIVPLFICLCSSFLFLLSVRLLSSFDLFVFFLGINVLNFKGIMCLKKQRTDLYFYCVIGMFLFFLFFTMNSRTTLHEAIAWVFLQEPTKRYIRGPLTNGIKSYAKISNRPQLTLNFLFLFFVNCYLLESKSNFVTLKYTQKSNSYFYGRCLI